MAARKYRSDVSNRNPWKEPTNSTKKPVPTVPKMAANVPAVFDIPRTKIKLLSMHFKKVFNLKNIFSVIFSSSSESFSYNGFMAKTKGKQIITHEDHEF